MISSLAKSQNLNCSDFKIGTFSIKSTNYELPTSTVIRTEKTQKESAVEIEMELEGTIEWKSECNYEFTYTKNASPEMLGKKISTEIIKIEGRKAICKATFEGLPGMVLEFEMEKLN
jgi:hypothetical protein